MIIDTTEIQTINSFSRLEFIELLKASYLHLLNTHTHTEKNHQLKVKKVRLIISPANTWRATHIFMNQIK